MQFKYTAFSMPMQEATQNTYLWQMRFPLLIFMVSFLPLVTNAGSAINKKQMAEDSAQYIQRVLNERATSMDFFKTTAILSDVSTVSAYSELDKITPSAWQKKPYLLDIQMNTPIPIGGKWFHMPRHGVYFAMQFHPDFDVRVLHNDASKGDTSSPVRTPSFKPGVSFFITCNRLWNNGNKPKHYFSLKIYHHSNGQDGPHFPAQYNGYWNRYNGDFSDDVIFDFVYGGILGEKIIGTEAKEMMHNKLWRTAPAYTYYWKGMFSLHSPTGLTPENPVYHIYGYYRSTAQFGFIWAPYYQEYVLNHNTHTSTPIGKPAKKEIFRVYATIDYIWDDDLNTGSIYSLSRVKMYDITKRMNAVITFSARIPGTPFAGIFAQGGYYASDPYNVYFEQSVWFIRVGLSAGYFIYDLNSDRGKKQMAVGF